MTQLANEQRAATLNAIQGFKDMKYGMFIHWGLYAKLGGYWQGKRAEGLAEWIQCQAKIPLSDYAKLAATFTAPDFDAEFIADLAAEAGMRYLVFTAKHHDGFAMYHSQVDRYNSVDATPFGRDPVAELAEACKERGVKFCLYYSQDLDWAHPDGGGNAWDFDPSRKVFGRYFQEKCLPQVEELLTNYGDIGLMWFDMPQNISRDQSVFLRDTVHRLQPNCLVSGRVGHGVGDFGSLGDNQWPLGNPEGIWETPGTLNHSWGFDREDHDWRTVDDVVGSLVDLASKGVNYLLNIGPDSTGKVPAPSVQTLRDVGDWLSSNGDAIYATQANPFNSEFSWGRATCRDKSLYLILNHAADASFLLPGLTTPVRSVSLLNSHPSDVVHRTDSSGGTPRLHLQLPAQAEQVKFPSLRIDCESEPRVVPQPCQQADGHTLLNAHQAAHHRHSGTTRRREGDGLGGALAAAQVAEFGNEVSLANGFGVGPSGVIENWFSTEDYVSWRFRLLEAGRYEARVRTIAPKYQAWVGGHRVTAQVDGHELTAEIVDDGRMNALRNYHFKEAWTRLGTVDFRRPGLHRLTLLAEHINPCIDQGLSISAVELLPSP